MWFGQTSCRMYMGRCGGLACPWRNISGIETDFFAEREKKGRENRKGTYIYHLLSEPEA